MVHVASVTVNWIYRLMPLFAWLHFLYIVVSVVPVDWINDLIMSRSPYTWENLMFIYYVTFSIDSELCDNHNLLREGSIFAIYRELYRSISHACVLMAVMLFLL